MTDLKFSFITSLGFIFLLLTLHLCGITLSAYKQGEMAVYIGFASGVLRAWYKQGYIKKLYTLIKHYYQKIN